MKRAEKKQVLVDHYFDFFMAALAVLKDEEDARDAVQDALVSTLVKTGVKEPYRYCMQAVRNRCVDMLRHRGHLRKLDENDAFVDPEYEALLRQVAEHKAKLPLLARSIVELHYEDGYSIPRVAEKLSISQARVKRVLADAKKELRLRIEE